MHNNNLLRWVQVCHDKGSTDKIEMYSEMQVAYKWSRHTGRMPILKLMGRMVTSYMYCMYTALCNVLYKYYTTYRCTYSPGYHKNSNYIIYMVAEK